MTFINSGTNPNKGLTNYHAQFKVVAVNPLTGAFLHMSGAGETRERAYAWVGTRNQFDSLSKTISVDYGLHSAFEKSNSHNDGA